VRLVPEPVAHVEGPGALVPVVCPACCALGDIPDWPEGDASRLRCVVGCKRCGFWFPNLPGEFKGLTLHAMRGHRCERPDQGDWAGLADAILSAMTGQGEYPELPSWPRAGDVPA
jgi:hypothetical protein